MFLFQVFIGISAAIPLLITSDRQLQAVLNRIDINEVLGYMSPQREEEGVSAAFEALKEVRLTEADEPFPTLP